MSVDQIKQAMKMPTIKTLLEVSNSVSFEASSVFGRFFRDPLIDRTNLILKGNSATGLGTMILRKRHNAS